MLIKIEDGSPVGHPILEDNFRLLNPAEVFPLVLTNEIVEPYGYAMYDYSQVPAVDWNQRLVEGEPARDENGIWRQTWVVETLDGEELEVAFAAAKEAKNNEINRARLQANRGEFTHGGKAFACDELSRSDIDGITASVTLNGVLPAWFPGFWKAKDNSLFPISTVDDWKAFICSMGEKGSENFVKSQRLKAQLAEATTYDEVQAIAW